MKLKYLKIYLFLEVNEKKKINKEETALYKLIKRAVRDGLQEELFRLRLEALPFVSGTEMQEIEKIPYGKLRARKASAALRSLKYELDPSEYSPDADRLFIQKSFRLK